MLTRQDLCSSLAIYQHFVDIATSTGDYDMLSKAIQDFASSGDFELVVQRFNPEGTHCNYEKLGNFYNEFLYCLLRRFIHDHLLGQQQEISIKSVLEQDMTWGGNVVNFVGLFDCFVTVGGDESWD